MPRTRASEGRKAAILDAAARLFGERGYAAVGMDDIGAAVEISGPSLYWHFPGKQALLDAVVLAAAERFAAAFEAMVADNPDAGFEDFVRLECRLALGEGAYAATLLSDAGHLSPEGLAAGLAVQARSERVARATLQRLNPGLDLEAAGVRLAAQVGPLVAVTRDRARRGSQRSLGRARLEELIVPSLVALAATPAAPRPPAPAPTTWAPHRSRREAILHGARRLFRDRGFTAVGIGDIGEAAGISAATVYHYFPGKTEILRAAWERETMRMVVGALAALDVADSAEDALRRLARAQVAVALATFDLVTVVYRELGDLPPEGAWADHRRVVFDLWGGVLDEVRPGLTEPERLVVTEMAVTTAVHAAAAVEGRPEWADDIAAQIAAFARGGPT